MLIKNEATNLRRTLPIWAKLVDYWLVGVDDANTDESVDIIKQYLGHLPGEIVTVHFDGMGPSWTQVMKVGIEKYPQADFGILADADHVPLLPWYDSVSSLCICFTQSLIVRQRAGTS
jgi:hypothetical protein